MQGLTHSSVSSVIRILIIEDDPTLSATLRYNLQKHGHHVTVAEDGLDGIKAARGMKPDIILLDLMLPNIEGHEVCRYLRRWTTSPILMLTALDREEDVIAGFEVGADDYVTKPFRMNELMARINALVRRSRTEEPESNTLIAGDLVVMTGEHRALYSGRELRLSPKEFQILIVLMRRAGKVCTRAELMKEAWGDGVVVDPRNVDVHVRLIRAQLEGEPDGSWLIQTVHGVGYRFAGELGPNPPDVEVESEGSTV